MVESVRDLSFIKDGRWSPERSGDYDADCRRGREHADEMLAMMQRSGSPVLFAGVARAITEAGQFDGVEAGFCARIGIRICN